MNLGFFVVFFPLISALFSSFFALSKPNRLPQFVSTSLLLGSSICSILLFKEIIFDKLYYNIKVFEFLNLYGLKSEFTIRVDSLSVIMMFLVTFVSSCVHLYSISYMDGDEKINRFFAYLSMFTFCMLILVSSDDFLQLFVGWEGVGVSSYLLISFWFKKNSASTAAMKAFIVNRVGDFGLIIAIGLCYYVFHTINFTEIAQIFPQYLNNKFIIFGVDFNSLTIIAIFIFIGCMGKSAQFGLHVWLPDAMEGPTPVSALIHAATMVTAGIFLMARCFYFFDASIDAQNFILIVSSITMIFAAICAIYQDDIKKTIAYSTCSQLGYMFVGSATAHYDAGMFHLVTHGFFKALLFLSAGSIIHATHEQDMNKLPNNLYKKMPMTFILMLIGTFAITGIPPFAGFYSKDAIIEALFTDTKHLGFGFFSYIVSIITVFLTSFYSWKLIFKIFFTTQNNIEDHSHESNTAILLPMFLLSILSIGSGFVLQKYFGVLSENNIFWQGSISSLESESNHVNIIIEFLPLILSLVGMIFSYYFYIVRSQKNKKSLTLEISPKLYNIFKNKFYIDEIYGKTIVKVVFVFASFFSFFDKNLLDRFGPNGIRSSLYCFSEKLKKIHSGLLYKYNFWQFSTLVFLVAYFVLFSWK